MVTTKEEAQNIVDVYYGGDKERAIEVASTLSRANHNNLILAQREERYDDAKDIYDAIRENASILNAIKEL
jgi:hypothetical protein